MTPTLDETTLEDLERRAVDLDARAAAIRTADQAAEVSAMRRFFLAELERGGALRAGPVATQLKSGRRPALAAYAAAADRLRAYYAGPERSGAVRGPAPEHLFGGPVSVDWFRNEVLPPHGYTPFTWLARCEGELEGASADGGRVLFRDGAAWYELHYRREDGRTPSLVAAVRL